MSTEQLTTRIFSEKARKKSVKQKLNTIKREFDRESYALIITLD